MKKKYIALAAALIMLLCALCACGKDEDTKTPEETGTPPAVSTAPSSSARLPTQVTAISQKWSL